MEVEGETILHSHALLWCAQLMVTYVFSSAYRFEYTAAVAAVVTVPAREAPATR